MNSIDKSCNDLKEQYDTCFNTWFSEKYLKGDANDSVCASLFKLYQQCIKLENMEACSDLKQKYDACFYVWFSERFLKGDHNDAICEPLLKAYKDCVKKAMKEQHIELNDIKSNHIRIEEEQKSPS